eukprot:TRINITY_DN3178_c0_g2_i1.p1 TRINITY_DN3178_c0_g2~~TRINITY_DN3178_c0_g2_i1.p1  ORF type:complete len:436 (+),score=98.98 TRINITY_DN3178_c0_g2_i1:78-1385(+)
MPAFAVLHGAAPAAAADDVVAADAPLHLGSCFRRPWGIESDSSAPLLGLVPLRRRRPRAAAPPSPMFATAFGEVVCKDGFRCVSSTNKFGKEHPQNGSVDGGDDNDDAGPDADPVYEWNCPYNGTWSPYRYTVGAGADECEMGGTDCMCVARGSSNFSSTMTDGEEVIEGDFGVDDDGSASTPSAAKARKLKIIPHYPMRAIPESFNIEDPHSNMGGVVNLPRREFMDKYPMYASLLQNKVDLLKKSIQKAMETTPDPVCGPGGKMAMPQVIQLQTKIRRFQMLTKDCELMRDAIGTVAPSQKDEMFPGMSGIDKLDCYRNRPGAARCQALNCYSGAVDIPFRNSLAEFRKKLDVCNPEVDATEDNANPPEKVTAASVGASGLLLTLVAPASARRPEASDLEGACPRQPRRRLPGAAQPCSARRPYVRRRAGAFL